jgi:sugar lactone lactonase YvrE
VVTLESRLSGVNPLFTQHPFLKTFAVPSNPQSIAVDQNAGYVYVLSAGAGMVRRFDTDGAPVNFTAGPNAGTNTLTGFVFGSGGQVESGGR